MEQMICVTVFPAACTFRCFNAVGSPVTANFTLTHFMASVRLTVVFQGNRNGIHPCRAMEKKHKSNLLKLLWVKQCVCFQGAADRLSDLVPAGAICLRAGGLVGEWGINVALSSDSGTLRFHSPPSSFCHTVNPTDPSASCGPAWRNSTEIKTERGNTTGKNRDRNKWKKELFGLFSNLVCATWFDGIYVDVGQSTSPPVAVWLSESKSGQWCFWGLLLFTYFAYFSISDFDWRVLIYAPRCCCGCF